MAFLEAAPIKEASRASARARTARGRFGRAAAWLLALIMVILTGFALVSATAMLQAGTDARSASILSDDYQQARYWVGAEESLERKYRVEPGPDVLAMYRDAGHQLLTALAAVRRDGTASDSDLVDAVLVKQQAYVHVILADMFPAVLAHDPARAVYYDHALADPLFNDVESRVFAAASTAHAEALTELSELDSTQRWVLIAGPLVFLLSGCVIIFLWRALSRYRRRVHEALEREVKTVRAYAAAEQQAIRRSEERQRALVQNVSDIIMVLDAQGNVTFAGPSIERILGYSPDSLLGSPVLALLHPEDAERLLQQHGAFPPESHDEVRFCHRDGSWRYLEASAVNLLDDPRIGGYVINAHDVTIRRQVEVELRDLARERAEQARAAQDLAALRSDFVAAVSHELRTPLAVVLGYAELLKTRWTGLDDDRRNIWIERIAVAANRQKRLIEDLLRVSRLESEDQSPESETLRVAELVDRAAELLLESYPDQQINRSGPTDLSAHADPSHAEQILTNLLDNSAKYSTEGSPIDVTWEQDGGMVAIHVRDYGPGIPEEGRSVLFSRFGRVPGSRMRAGRVGTGLGLYLGRESAIAMGGTLDLEATGPEGSVFCLRLPLRALVSNQNQLIAS